MKQSTAIRKMLERLKQHPDNDFHAGHRQIAAHVTRLAVALEALESIAMSRDPTETEASHAKRVAAAAEKLEAKTRAIEELITADLREHATKLDQAAVERAGLRENQYAQEIRASVRGMDSEARLNVLHQAVASGDAATVAALTGAPSVVTGIGPEISSKMLESFRHTHAPEPSAAIDSLMENYSTAIQASGVVRKAATAAVDPSFISLIQKQEAAAQRAAADFDSAMN